MHVDFGAKKKPVPPRPAVMILPGGKELILDEIVEGKKEDEYGLTVASRGMTAEKVVANGIKRAERVLGREGLLLDRTLKADPLTIIVPSPIGPVPAIFRQKGWAAVRLIVRAFPKE